MILKFMPLVNASFLKNIDKTGYINRIFRLKNCRCNNELFVPADKSDAVSAASFDEECDADYRKKIKYGSRFQAAWALIVEFCSNSSVHGVRYFTERKRHWSERAWWLIAFTFSTIACGFLIYNVYEKWVGTPVIVSFAEKSTPIWEIPFPAVTICPETKTHALDFNFTAVWNSLRITPLRNNTKNESDYDELTMRRFHTMIQLCDTHISGMENFKNGTGPYFEDNTFYDHILDMAPGYSETMWFCKWRNSFSDCSEFQSILTDEGLCYTFNNLNSGDIYTDQMAPEMMIVMGNPNITGHWELQEGYNPSVQLNETYPQRVFGAGARAGFFALLKLNETDADYTCRGPVQGFKVLLHIPGEVPQVSKHYLRVPLLEEVLISIKPNMITTSDSLRSYKTWERQCYFTGERELRFFKIYTQRNCELECLSNYTDTKCGCVKFSLPRDVNTKICGSRNIDCYNKAEDELMENFFTEGLNKTTKEFEEGKGCNCLPSCTSIAYDAEISQAKFDWKSTFIALESPPSEFPGASPARLSIYFKEHQFITSKRSELYGYVDFLGACGGLLGLFMGVSVLSIVECLYYFTLRLGCSLQMRRSRKRKSLRRMQKNKIAPADKNNADIPNITVITADEKRD